MYNFITLLIFMVFFIIYKKDILNYITIFNSVISKSNEKTNEKTNDNFISDLDVLDVEKSTNPSMNILNNVTTASIIDVNKYPTKCYQNNLKKHIYKPRYTIPYNYKNNLEYNILNNYGTKEMKKRQKLVSNIISSDPNTLIPFNKNILLQNFNKNLLDKFEDNLYTINKTSKEKKKIYLLGRWKDNKYYINWSVNNNFKLNNNIKIYYKEYDAKNYKQIKIDKMKYRYNEGILIRKKETLKEFFYYYFIDIDIKKKYKIYVKMDGVKSNMILI